jgi:hypothetical protein
VLIVCAARYAQSAIAAVLPRLGVEAMTNLDDLFLQALKLMATGLLMACVFAAEMRLSAQQGLDLLEAEYSLPSFALGPGL